MTIYLAKYDIPQIRRQLPNERYLARKNIRSKREDMQITTSKYPVKERY